MRTKPTKKDDFNIGGDHIDVRTSSIVTMNESFTLMCDDGPVYLDVNITADFATIPVKYHEVFINILTSKYLNKVSFSSNPFSACKVPDVKKWWQFWKHQ
jgi:hypothetical protein